MAVFIGNKGFQAALQGKKADHDILQIITRTLILRAIITCTVAKKKNLSSAFTKDKSSPVTWKDSARLRKQLVFVVEPSFWLPGGFFFFLHGFNTARPDYLQGTRRNKKNTPPLFHCALKWSVFILVVKFLHQDRKHNAGLRSSVSVEGSRRAAAFFSFVF